MGTILDIVGLILISVVLLGFACYIFYIGFIKKSEQKENNNV